MSLFDTTERREEQHCPKCDGTNIFFSLITEGGMMCRGCNYSFVDQRNACTSIEVPRIQPPSSPTPQPITSPQPVKSVVIPIGTYTIVNLNKMVDDLDEEDNDYVTLRVKKATFIKDADKLMVSYLMGSDNDTSYKGFAFVNPTGIAVWSRFKSDSRIVQAAKVLWNIAQHEAGLTDAHELFLEVAEAYAMRSGRCMRCGHTLTVPASLHRGLGPICAGIEGV
jgi:hypothetical protein